MGSWTDCYYSAKAGEELVSCTDIKPALRFPSSGSFGHCAAIRGRFRARLVRCDRGAIAGPDANVARGTGIILILEARNFGVVTYLPSVSASAPYRFLWQAAKRAIRLGSSSEPCRLRITYHRPGGPLRGFRTWKPHLPAFFKLPRASHGDRLRLGMPASWF